jgi:hypothetical protein
VSNAQTDCEPASDTADMSISLGESVNSGKKSTKIEKIFSFCSRQVKQVGHGAKKLCNKLKYVREMINGL